MYGRACGLDRKCQVRFNRCDVRFVEEKMSSGSFIGNTGTSGSNGDGSVNVLDLIDLLLAFGIACP